MKICTDRDCPNRALRNSPMCMEHVKLASGADFPMRDYQMEMLRQVATMQALMARLDAQRAADSKRDREKVWNKAGMEGITLPQTATQHGQRWREKWDARGWFGHIPNYNTRENRAKPDYDWQGIRKLWK